MRHVVRVEPGRWHGHWRAVCDMCDFNGESRFGSTYARSQAEKHERESPVERVIEGVQERMI